jgi:heparosan-N-sulfate-glucuronate 5-epimerase
MKKRNISMMMLIMLLVCLPPVFEIQLVESTRVAVYFDKALYCPDIAVFSQMNVSVAIGIEVIDYNTHEESVTVKISSSVDSRDITLNNATLGDFIGTISAVGLRLGEPVSNTTCLNVRYGDVIIAQYYDTFNGETALASALFGFPMYIMDEASVSLDDWKFFDSDGVALANYGTSTAPALQYNPVTTSEYALANYHFYVTTGNSTFRDTFLVQANWLVKNADKRGNFAVWEYKFDWPSYNATNPWVSAMAEGQGLSVLTRAYVLTGNSTYLDVAQTAMRSFEVEMNSGGVRDTDSSGVWFEEVADVGIPSSKVLNGFIFSLLGLYEYSFLTNSSEGYALFWEGTHTLSLNLYRYDTGSWSRYDLLYSQPASLGYHILHIKQLKIMCELTNFGEFLVYSNKFQSYLQVLLPTTRPQSGGSTDSGHLLR